MGISINIMQGSSLLVPRKERSTLDLQPVDPTSRKLTTN